MSARVYLHPRCAIEGPAFAALAAHLQERGVVLEGLCAYHPGNERGSAELVRKIAEAGTIVVYERMDQTRFQHSLVSAGPCPPDVAA